MTDLVDVSDPKTVAAALKTDKSLDTRTKEGLRLAMSDQNGRAWLHKILLLCGCFTNPFSSDPLRMAHSCGEANIGLQIIADMQDVSPELYLQTMKENNG